MAKLGRYIRRSPYLFVGRTDAEGSTTYGRDCTFMGVAVPKGRTEVVRKELYNLIPRGVRFKRKGDTIIIPVKGNGVHTARARGYELVEETFICLQEPLTPFEQVLDELSYLPSGFLSALPRKWELLGDVLLLVLPKRLWPIRTAVAQAYAHALAAKTVLAYFGIQGELRNPRTVRLWGDGTETVHRENRIFYKMDVARLMFSSGNIDERIRMGRIVERGETVVDLFAGIGYFTLPAAVHGGADVIACEKNRVAVHYLKENLRLNRVQDRVEVRQGDCREVAPWDVADRVIMGYVGPTHTFLDAGFRALSERGWLHYHETCPRKKVPERPLGRVLEAAERNRYTVLKHSVRRIKSYAPEVVHVVVDAFCEL